MSRFYNNYQNDGFFNARANEVKQWRKLIKPTLWQRFINWLEG